MKQQEKERIWDLIPDAHLLSTRWSRQACNRLSEMATKRLFHVARPHDVNRTLAESKPDYKNKSWLPTSAPPLCWRKHPRGALQVLRLRVITSNQRLRVIIYERHIV